MMPWKTPNPLLPKVAPPPISQLEQLYDAQKQIKHLQDLLKNANLQKEEYKAEVERLRSLLDSICDIADRAYDTTA